VLTFAAVGPVGAIDPSPPVATAAEPAVTSTVAGNLGTNLGAVTYYDGLVPFANLMDQAGDWVSDDIGVV
jgi:hypothetical protein